MTLSVLPAWTSVWGCWVLWYWSYRQVWAAMWVLGMEPGFSGRAVNALNHWTISPAPKAKCLTHKFCNIKYLSGGAKEVIRKIGQELRDLTGVEKKREAAKAWNPQVLCPLVCFYEEYIFFFFCLKRNGTHVGVCRGKNHRLSEQRVETLGCSNCVTLCK